MGVKEIGEGWTGLSRVGTRLRRMSANVSILLLGREGWD